MSQYDPIPSHMLAAMQQYVATGEVSSHFLIAVIENDLRMAVAHADDRNRTIIYLYSMWFYNRAPMQCWGSPEKRAEWIQHHERIRNPDTMERVDLNTSGLNMGDLASAMMRDGVGS